MKLPDGYTIDKSVPYEHRLLLGDKFIAIQCGQLGIMPDDDFNFDRDIDAVTVMRDIYDLPLHPIFWV